MVADELYLFVEVVTLIDDLTQIFLSETGGSFISGISVPRVYKLEEEKHLTCCWVMTWAQVARLGCGVEHSLWHVSEKERNGRILVAG